MIRQGAIFDVPDESFLREVAKTGYLQQISSSSAKQRGPVDVNHFHKSKIRNTAWSFIGSEEKIQLVTKMETDLSASVTGYVVGGMGVNVWERWVAIWRSLRIGFTIRQSINIELSVAKWGDILCVTFNWLAT